jgi:hypothetical protein
MQIQIRKSINQQINSRNVAVEARLVGDDINLDTISKCAWTIRSMSDSDVIYHSATAPSETFLNYSDNDGNGGFTPTIMITLPDDNPYPITVIARISVCTLEDAPLVSLDENDNLITTIEEKLLCEETDFHSQTITIKSNLPQEWV